MNVLFIYSSDNIDPIGKPLQKPGKIYFGISYLSSILKKNGYNTGLIVLSRMFANRNLNFIDEKIKSFNPKVIGLTSVASEYQFIKEIAGYIKRKYPEIFLIIGGPHISLNPEEGLGGEFDALCLGEGEYPLLELVSQIKQGIKPTGIQNIWFISNNGIERNSLRPYNENLDEIPFPDREIWTDFIDDEPDMYWMILLGRGCPYQCTYCSNHALRKLTGGKYVRFRSPQNIIEEIRDIITKRPDKKHFYLEVETIGINNKWTLELCEMLANLNYTLDIPLTYGTNLRIIPRMDYNVIFEYFRMANFKYLNIGLESGSEKIRKDVLKRQYSNEDFIGAVQTAKKFDLKTNIYNLIGIPYETQEDFNETIRVNRLAQPTKLWTSIFYPYPGTDLYYLSKENQLFVDADLSGMERIQSMLKLPDFPQKAIMKNYIWFDYNVYKGYKSIYILLLNVLINKLIVSRYFKLINKLIFFKPLRKIIRKIIR